jgi:hypothetical protein
MGCPAGGRWHLVGYPRQAFFFQPGTCRRISAAGLASTLHCRDRAGRQFHECIRTPGRSCRRNHRRCELPAVRLYLCRDIQVRTLGPRKTWRAAAAGGVFTGILFAIGRFALAARLEVLADRRQVPEARL